MNRYRAVIWPTWLWAPRHQQSKRPARTHRMVRSNVVLGIPLVAGALHREVPVEVLHLPLLLDKVLADTVQRHDQRMPVLSVNLLLEGQLIPLQVTVLTLMAVLDRYGRKLQHLLELLLSDVDALLPVLHLLVSELDLAPGVLRLADRDLHHRCWTKSWSRKRLRNTPGASGFERSC